MTYSQSILPEFDQEMATTRRVLERVPDDKLQWRAHPRSNTIGWNACHIAELPGWAMSVLTQPSFDFAPVGAERYQTPMLGSQREILEMFDRNVAAVREALASVSDEEMEKRWSLLSGGSEILAAPRRQVMRTFVMNHIIHHRAILSVYLRLNDIPVPGIYGPSGDEG